MTRSHFPRQVDCTRAALVLCTAAALFAQPRQLGAQIGKRPFEAWSNSAQLLRDSIVQLAKSQLGTRYKLGGQSPEKGFDCSGLVQYVMSALSLDVPRTARLQANAGLAVKRDTSRLLPGDVLTFASGQKGVSHVGIYVGGGRFIHASSAAGQVIESPVDRHPGRLVKGGGGARRNLSFDDDSAATARTSGSRR